MVKRGAGLLRPIGHVAWAAGGSCSPPFGLPPTWPRCLACDLTNTRDIVPALVETPHDAPLCREHMDTSGFGLFYDLEPPCALCGEPCDEMAAEYRIPDPVSPVRGYLCPEHSTTGRLE